MKLSIICILYFFLSLQLNARELPIDMPYKIKESEAAKLAAMANENSLKNIEAYGYEKEMDPLFFTYDEYGLNGDSLGFYSVNPWTGDVWDFMECKEISTPTSRKMQATIRKRFTTNEIKLYKKLSKLMPCTPD